MPDGRLVVGLAQGREHDHGEIVQIEQFSVELVDLGARDPAHDHRAHRWTRRHRQPDVSPDGRTVVYKRWNSWRTKPKDGQALYAVASTAQEAPR